MKQKEFMDRLNLCFKTNEKDLTLLSNSVRAYRSRLLLHTINTLSKTLSFFDFKDNIVFEQNIPFIIIDNIKFLLNHQIYLKHTGKKYVSSCNESIKFLEHFNITPKNIIDLGACWGEFSLFLGRRFPDSNIFSIEGSEKNFETLNINLEQNKNLSRNIKSFNLIISDKDGFEEISDSVSTVNALKSIINKDEITYKKIQSNKLETFVKNNKFEIDFLKIDIEGSELKLLSDLKTTFSKSMQIELIHYNSIDLNIDFLEQLSENYNFYNPKGWTLLNMKDLKKIVKETLNIKPTIDVFLINKNYNLKF